MARLGDICEILDSKRIPITASNRKAGIYPYYGANGIQDYVDDYIFDDELVLLAEDGGHFGSTDKPIAYRVSGKCWVNNHAHVLKPKSNLDVDYLCYSLMFRDVSNIVNGATRQKLTQADMIEIEIPLLPLGEQLAIVEKLNKIFALIFLRKQQLCKLNELVKSRFIEMFGDPNSNPMHWNKVELSECLVNIENGKSFVCDSEPRIGDKPAVLKLSAATYGYYQPHENKAMLDDTLFVKSAEVHKGDLLFTRKNTPELVGMCAYVYDTPPKLMMPDLIFRLNTRANCDKVFLWKIINLDLFRSNITALSSGSAKSMSNISKERLLGLEIILPPIALQQQFAAFVEQIDKSKLAIQKSLEKLETLKKALMQKYFG